MYRMTHMVVFTDALNKHRCIHTLARTKIELIHRFLDEGLDRYDWAQIESIDEETFTWEMLKDALESYSHPDCLFGNIVILARAYLLTDEERERTHKETVDYIKNYYLEEIKEMGLF